MMERIPEPCVLCGDVTTERIIPFDAPCCGHCTAIVANGGQPAIVAVGQLAVRLTRREKYLNDLRRTVMESFEIIDEVILVGDAVADMELTQ